MLVFCFDFIADFHYSSHDSLRSPGSRKDFATLTARLWITLASFATLRLHSCLYSPGLRCLCCSVVQFFRRLGACSLVTVDRQTVGRQRDIHEYKTAKITFWKYWHSICVQLSDLVFLFNYRRAAVDVYAIKLCVWFTLYFVPYHCIKNGATSGMM
jgi:hypothetical protein